MQEGFGKEPSALKVKSSKRGRGGGGGGEIVEVQGGGRILRSIGRKDRHSKVCTARGPRDRRLRLSANIAIQFYDVQDRLGYDRPSEAIDWLMKEAKSAIDALAEKKKPDDKAQQLEQHQQEEQNQCEFSNEEPINSLSFLIPSSSSTEFESLANWSNPQTIGFGNYQRKIGGYVTDTMPQWQQQQQQKVVLGQQDQLFSQGGTLQSSCFSPSFLALMNPQISGLNYDQMPEISSSLAGAGGDSFSGDGLSGFCVPPRVRGGEEERHNPVPNKPSSGSCLLHYHGL